MCGDKAKRGKKSRRAEMHCRLSYCNWPITACLSRFSKLLALTVETRAYRAHSLFSRCYLRDLGATSTSLESLVTCFEELKELQELEQPLSVDGVGDLTFRRVFRHVSLGPTSQFALYYGGARLQDKRYGGTGFVLKFIDRLHEKPISIYVSPGAIRGYRPSARMVKMMNDLEAHAVPKPYVRAYWIGELEDSEKGWNAKFKTLSHVVLRVVPLKEKPQDEGPDEDSAGQGS